MSLEDNNDSSCVDSQEQQSTDVEAKQDSLLENVKSSEVSGNTEIQSGQSVATTDQERHVFESKFEEELHNEVLEKLDIVKRMANQDIQEKSMQDNLKNEAQVDKLEYSEKLQVKNQIEKSLVNDFSKIQEFVKAGLINSSQGQNLKKQVLKKAFDKLVQTEKIKRKTPALNSNVSVQSDKNEVFSEFSKSNPEFLTQDGRKDVLNYLKS